MGEFALGQPVPRFEDPRLLRGGGRYVDGFVFPRMVFGHVLRSPHAHARIRAIDTRAAKQMPGVLAVLTGADWQASGWGDLPAAGGMKRPGGLPSYKPRFPALVGKTGGWLPIAPTRETAAGGALGGKAGGSGGGALPGIASPILASSSGETAVLPWM